MGAIFTSLRGDDQKPTKKQNTQTKENQPIKLLLLGTGESGKSTIFRQCKILFKNAYKQDYDRIQLKEVVRENIIVSMKALLYHAGQLNLELQESNQEAKKKLDSFNLDTDTSKEYTEEVGKMIASLWKDPAIQKAFQDRSAIQLLDSAEFFFNNIERISAKDYVPTIEDIIKTRVKTTGITELDFEHNGKKIKLVDVGGQRNERRKWIHCFEDVKAVIFVVSLSEYDLLCYEDNSTPRMEESLKVFDDICNSKYFPTTPFIVLFNKEDLFNEKIKRSDLKRCFSDYDGGKDVEAGKKFIQQKFLDENKTTKKIYPFTMCATDIESVKAVFEQVKEIAANLT